VEQASGRITRAAHRLRAPRQGDVALGTERNDHIEQHARAAEAPQHEGGNAQQESGGPCYP
jgi:hypothetical protein